MPKPYAWSRFAKNPYEVSTAGDKRFSALVARLRDGRTIEEAYQLDVKGFRSVTRDWRDAKGKKPLIAKTREQTWQEYLALWRQWARENESLIIELAIAAQGKILTDKFAATSISQARALAEILNDFYEGQPL